MERPDEAAPISVAQNEAFGYLGMDYANGARALFWPTDVADSSISFTAPSFGGLSLVEIEDLTEAEYGAQNIAQSGLGGHDQVMVDRILVSYSRPRSPSLAMSYHRIPIVRSGG